MFASSVSHSLLYLFTSFEHQKTKLLYTALSNFLLFVFKDFINIIWYVYYFYFFCARIYCLYLLQTKIQYFTCWMNNNRKLLLLSSDVNGSKKQTGHKLIHFLMNQIYFYHKLDNFLDKFEVNDCEVISVMTNLNSLCRYLTRRKKHRRIIFLIVSFEREISYNGIQNSSI